MFISLFLFSQIVAAEKNEKTDILFDMSKEMDTKFGNPEVQSDRLGEILDKEGLTYLFSPELTSLTHVPLDQYNIVVIWDPDGVYSDEEIEAIVSYVNGGGNLIVFGNSLFGMIGEVRSSMNKLLSNFGIQLNNDKVLDKTNFVGCHCGTTPLITVFADDSYFDEIETIALSNTSSLSLSGDAFAIAWGDDDAFADADNNEALDEGEIQGGVPVIAQCNYGKGTVVVFGTDKVFDRMTIIKVDNKKLASSLFSRLTREEEESSGTSNSNVYYLGAAVLVVLSGVFLYLLKSRKKS
ncbi:MAG: Gldg family protein [Candidatus Methanofastidiosia archaeon]